MKTGKTGNRQYRIRFNAHCGMPYNIAGDLASIQDARNIVAIQLRQYRNDGYEVNVIKSGVEWELTEPENAFIVPDDAGFMTIQSRRSN